MIQRLAVFGLGSLLLAVSGTIWVFASAPGALAVLAGGILPMAISLASLLIFFAFQQEQKARWKHERFVLVNFLAKVVLIGLWTTAIFLGTSLPRAPFVISLLVNFMAWHGYEAYRYQQKHQVARQARG